MATRSSLRASDADRERVAEHLRQAAVDGRILAHELEERLAVAFRARTYGELDGVIADLPQAPSAGRRRSRSRELLMTNPAAFVAVLVAVMLLAVVLAAVAFAASGAWFAFVIVMLVVRGRRYGGRRYPGGYVGTRRGSVQVHVHHHSG